MLTFKDYLEEDSKQSGCNCWTGYKRKPGTKPCAEGSCIKEGKRGLWDNIHAKQERIKNGSGERMRKPGSKGAPTAAALKASQTNEAANMAQQAAIAIAMKKAGKKPKNEEVEIEEGAFSSGQLKPSKELLAKADKIPSTGTIRAKDAKGSYTAKTVNHKEVSRVYDTKEEVEEQFDLIEQMVIDIAEQHNLDPEIVWEKFEEVSDEELYEAAVDAKGYKSSTGGLTQKGRDAYNSKGAHLQAPVTTPPSKLKAGSKAANRRKSFCARMGGMEGAMKKPNGEPTRKALALRKWNC